LYTREVGSVKTSYRQLQAQATRELIASSARLLFARDGYGATTIEAIAAKAGVAVQTVYASFGSKKAILASIRQAWLRESRVSELSDRALREPDAARRLEIAADWTRRQWEGGIDVIFIYQGAATSSPEMAAERRAVLDGRKRAVAKFMQEFARVAALAPGMDFRRATDVFWALTMPGLYGELVLERGWSPARYQQWLADTLKQQLLLR
jgi:TetR/AcrR family transcriptional regulator, regulator of autoinduction and epiphytic fitness